MPKEEDKVIKAIENALEDDNIPKIYANSFACALGVGDISIVLQNGIKSEALLNLSYSSAKTLSILIQELIGFLESKSKNEIMTTSQIKDFLAIDEGDINDTQS